MIVANQVPLSMGFPRQEYWSGLPFPSPGDLPDPGITPMSLMSLALASGFLTTSTTWEAQIGIQITTEFFLEKCLRGTKCNKSLSDGRGAELEDG